MFRRFVMLAAAVSILGFSVGCGGAGEQRRLRQKTDQRTCVRILMARPTKARMVMTYLKASSTQKARRLITFQQKLRGIERYPGFFLRSFFSHSGDINKLPGWSPDHQPE